MNGDIIALMLGVSIFLGLFGLIAVVWGLKNGQFDDEKKWTHGVLLDGVDELNDVYKNEIKNKEKNNG